MVDKGAAPDEPASPFSITVSDEVAARPHVLKSGDAFAVFDRFGYAQATGPGAEGLFFEDTRYVARLVLTIDGKRPLFLSSTVSVDNTTLSADLTNPELTADGDHMRLPGNTIHILTETRLAADGMTLLLHLHNFGMVPAEFSLRLDFDADFADIFEVRGAVRKKRGERLNDGHQDDGVVLGYRGLDGVTRRTRFIFSPLPTRRGRRHGIWNVQLERGEERLIAIDVHCRRDPAPSPRSGDRHAPGRPGRRHPPAGIETSNEHFDEWIGRSYADIEMLVTETPDGPYAYAGIPWFSTPFGRDGIVTALQCLWLDPELAAGTLRFLAANQATVLDPRADAEPGKILHETRRGEMAAMGEVPFGRYYGSVDATPLFVMLAAAYHARTGDGALIRSIWPNIEAALAWMRDYGDLDGDGFIEYDRRSPNGLVNQGWKDSADSISHGDGRLAEAPIALAEVQAYAYAAYLGAAAMANALGHHDRGATLVAEAARLQAQFDAAFWIEELGTYAIALDGHKQPCRVRASNAGHVLFAGLATPERARVVARTLTEPPCFSGWGIRTLARTEARYNPLSYHNGSVWPHDNALIAMGFGRYGLKQQLLAVLTSLFDAAQHLELRRLPELFCGLQRRPGIGPTAYPVACVPQAWSSATVFALLQAALGISFDAEAGRLSFTQPTMPAWLDECRLSNLRLGASSIDLLLRRTRDDVAIHVLRRDGSIDITVTI